MAHRKFWRQVIFWLSHKENDSDNQVKLNLDKRRISVGQKVELTVNGTTQTRTTDASGRVEISGLTAGARVKARSAKAAFGWRRAPPFRSWCSAHYGKPPRILGCFPRSCFRRSKRSRAPSTI